MRHLLPEISHKHSIRHLGALSSLSINRLIGFIGGSFVGMFLPIFIYEYFSLSLTTLILYFVITYALRIPLLVIFAKQFERIGLVASMIIGTICWALYYVTVFLLQLPAPLMPMLLLGLSLVFAAILSSTYWSPFHVDFTRFSTKGKRGRQVSTLYAAKDFIAVIGPIVGGFLIGYFSYGAIFGFAMVVILTSIIPLLFLPKTTVHYEYGFFESYKKMFEKKYRYMTFAMIAHGAESIVGVVIWPIFLFSVFDGKYLNVGIFASLIVFVSIFLRLSIGKWLDHHKRKKILKIGVDIYALGWLLKAFVTSVGGVFAASTFHSFGSIMMQTPLDVMTYEKAADAGHFIDEFTTLREVALNIGRVTILLIIIPVASLISLQATFILAALISLGITLFAKFTMKEQLPSLK
jgi:MFS family permease